jgi:hypothetical protein
MLLLVVLLYSKVEGVVSATLVDASVAIFDVVLIEEVSDVSDVKDERCCWLKYP